MTGKKRLVSIRSEINLDSNTIKFWAWDNVNEKVLNGLSITTDVGKVNPAMHPYAILDGIKDSIRDAGALGAGATLKAKFDAMRERSDYLTSGASEWAQRGKGISEGSLLFRALSAVYPTKTPQELRDYIQKRKSETDKAHEQDNEKPVWNTVVAAMLRSEKLRSKVEELRAADAKGADVEDLFEELEDN